MTTESPALIFRIEANRGRRTGSFILGLVVNSALVLLLATLFGTSVLRTRSTTGTAVLIAPRLAPVPPKAEHARAIAAPRPVLPPTPAAAITLPATPVVSITKAAALPVTPPVPLPPVNVAPPVVTGLFSSAASVRAPAGIEDPPVTQLGSFSSPNPTASMSAERSSVQTGSFGAAQSSTTAPGRGDGHVVAAAFGSVSNVSRRENRAATVAASGFDALQRPARQRAAEPVSAEPVFRSVEILTKPKPQYTEEARQLKIEGEVWLEVLFGGNGSVRIQRVIHSLGHGLDENAIRAAAQIRFRPAESRTGTVDQIATVRVQFQLAN